MAHRVKSKLKEQNVMKGRKEGSTGNSVKENKNIRNVF